MTSKNNFFKILEKAKVEIAEDIPTTGFIDTGSYALNALLAGSMYNGGIPNNRTVMYAGDPSAGKTYLILEGVKAFQQNEPDGNAVYFDTEFALDEDAIAARGIDLDRFHLVQPDHWQQFKTQALNILEAYEAEKPGKKERKPPMLMVLDSLGQLPTKKEIEDTSSGSDTKDMTKAAIAKSAFRILTQKMGKNQVPMLIANHTYDSLSAYTAKAIAGGSGGLYAASTIVMLSKSSDKETNKITKKDEVVGNIIRATTYKSRYTKEKQTVELRLDFETGLDRYYGLLPIAIRGKLIKKVSTQMIWQVGPFSVPVENEKGELEVPKFFGKEIEDDPEKFWTKDVMDALEVSVKAQFGFGSKEVFDDVDGDEEETDTEE